MQIGRSEELGKGLKNVFKYSKAYSGSDEILFQEDDVFTTKVPLRKSNATVNATVNERQKGILKKANEDRNITISQLAEKLNVSRDTILRDIKKLKILKIIKRVGSDKTGYWEVIE
mgnify:CR=1 FL=1